MLIRLCPSWSAISRTVRPPSSSRVAVVFRKTCVVTQSKPSLSRASRTSELVFDRSRILPCCDGKIRSHSFSGDS